MKTTKANLEVLVYFYAHSASWAIAHNNDRWAASTIVRQLREFLAPADYRAVLAQMKKDIARIRSYRQSPPKAPTLLAA